MSSMNDSLRPGNVQLVLYPNLNIMSNVQNWNPTFKLKRVFYPNRMKINAKHKEFEAQSRIASQISKRMDQQVRNESLLMT